MQEPFQQHYKPIYMKYLLLLLCFCFTLAACGQEKLRTYHSDSAKYIPNILDTSDSGHRLLKGRWEFQMKDGVFVFHNILQNIHDTLTYDLQDKTGERKEAEWHIRTYLAHAKSLPDHVFYLSFRHDYGELYSIGLLLGEAMFIYYIKDNKLLNNGKPEVRSLGLREKEL